MKTLNDLREMHAKLNTFFEELGEAGLDYHLHHAQTSLAHARQAVFAAIQSLEKLPASIPQKQLIEGTRVNIRLAYRLEYVGLLNDFMPNEQLVVEHVFPSGEVACRTQSGESLALPMGHLC